LPEEGHPVLEEDARADLDALESRLAEARNAVRLHLHSGVAIRGGESTGGSAALDQAWLDRYQDLKEDAERALAAANDAWTAWIADLGSG
jgi:hypothetical protein